jgi:hypothetical protein
MPNAGLLGSQGTGEQETPTMWSMVQVYGNRSRFRRRCAGGNLAAMPHGMAFNPGSQRRARLIKHRSGEPKR